MNIVKESKIVSYMYNTDIQINFLGVTNICLNLKHDNTIKFIHARL